MLYIPIGGTWKESGPDAWYRAGSGVDAVCRSEGFARLEQDADPLRPDAGYWSGDLGGTLVQQFAPWIDQHAPWRAGADELVAVIRKRTGHIADAGGAVIIAHSHGGQVAALGLSRLLRSYPAPLHVITIDTPIRRGMRRVYRAAMHRVHTWTHLHTGWGWSSRMRWLGARLNGPRLDGAANVPIAGGAGHSGIVRDPRHHWQLRPHLARIAERG